MNKKIRNISREIELATNGWQDYELIDSGNSRKLERFGAIQLARFEPLAIWKPALPLAQWQQSQAEFQINKGESSGQWNIRNDFPREWTISLLGLKLQLRVQKSRHVGIFPEQLESWKWIEEKIHTANREIRVLNLFGYTGIASLFAARGGAAVTHVDAARSAVKWAQVNQELSGLKELPIRWIVDDAMKFIQREARRGVEYDGIILDPPKFGRGPKGETWKFENSVQDLLAACADILSENPLFVYLTAYNVQNSPYDLSNWLTNIMYPYKGELEYGSLIQQEKSAGRKINQAMFARWFK